MKTRKYPQKFNSISLFVFPSLVVIWVDPYFWGYISVTNGVYFFFSHNTYLVKFKDLHLQLLQQFEIERTLSSKANLLTKQLMNELLNLEKA